MTAKSTTPAALTWIDVTARRMARHALAEPVTDLGPAGIVDAILRVRPGRAGQRIWAA
jgi:hypothetical protein